ncbi:MAG TPA: hypothetical protein VMB70_05525 [Terriglobia bacterium]|nr:hypothetical protein [Terriglobia bacterium]
MSQRQEFFGLVIGEVLPMMIRDGSRVAPIKVEVILTQEKQLGYNRTLWTRFAPARG